MPTRVNSITASVSIARRLASIRRLARHYFGLPKGALIERHTERLRVFDIRGSSHKRHPHKMQRVYITRRALKHVIESRREELLKNHTPEEALNAICFAIDHLKEAITNYDKYEHEPPTHYYSKDFASEGRPILRIALDEQPGGLEIKSIHFKKRK